MKTSGRPLWIGAALVVLLSRQTGPAAGTVTVADENNLRAALAGGGLVVFAVDGTIVLSHTLAITNSTVLDASGRRVTLSGGGVVRVLHVQPNASLTLKHLTVADGAATNSANGAGLLNLGKSIISECTFSNNVLFSASSPPPGFGAAISHGGGTLTVNDSTFVNNRCDSSGAAIGVNVLDGSASGFAITNCTFFGNSNGYATGSTINGFTPIPSPYWIVNCTLVSNINGGIAFGSLNASDTNATVVNTIVAHPIGGSNFPGGGFSKLVDGGHNISSDSGAVLTNSTSLTVTDPLLGPLADNGGPTWTAALQSGSPAIDSGDDAASPTQDQRGLHRFHAPCDIGAVESVPAFAVSGRIGGYRIPSATSLSVGTNIVSATTDGRYLIFGLNAGNHAVIPTAAGWVFIPNIRQVLLGPDAVNVNFTAYPTNVLTPESPVGHFVFAGPTGRLYQVQAATNPNSWTAYSTNIVQTNGIFEILDTNAANYRARFFRTLTID